MRSTVAGCFALFATLSLPAQAEEEFYLDVSGKITFDSISYTQDPAFSGQKDRANGVIIEPEFYLEHPSGWSFTLAPFLRYDSADDRREQADVREAKFLWYGDVGGGEWEFRLGVDRVFWGVAETTNLVDIINQTDLVEHPNGKVKRGQLMAHLTLSGDWGAAELFFMPKHEERTFPGRSGRFRPQLVIDTNAATYEDIKGEKHDDFAFRYSNTIGLADVGVSVFKGTSREPSVRLVIDELGRPKLIPHYEQIRQTGLDVGLPVGDFLFKLEAVRRTGFSNLHYEKDKYSAYIIGAEYTFYGVLESPYDVTLLGEWLYDDRGSKSTSNFQDDIFLAARMNFNDVSGTEIVASLLDDQDYDSRSMTLEFRRRINDEWLFEVESIQFTDSDPADSVLFPTRQDSFIKMSVSYSF